MTPQQKYRLLEREDIVPMMRGWNSGATPLFRIQAARDIPEHGVKEGDVGGYVSSKNILSHEGSCWIADNAMVIQNVVVQGNAYIGGNAVVSSRFDYTYIVLDGNVKVMDYAQILINRGGETTKSGTSIVGDVQIYGHSIVNEVGRISGNVRICDNAFLDKADSIVGDGVLWGNVNIGKGAKVFGASNLSGDVQVSRNATVTDCTLSGRTSIPENDAVANLTLHDGSPVDGQETLAVTNGNAVATPAPVISIAQQQHALNILDEVKADIAAYETDIVKIIKYPVMTDRTDAHTRDMVRALKNAQRHALTPASQEFLNAVDELEKAFLTAESNAMKIASTNFSETDKKKTEKAKDLFRIASNEASSEQEKKVAFIQGFKQLEGVIAVPEVAVDTFRVKVGLLELESGF